MAHGLRLKAQGKWQRGKADMQSPCALRREPKAG